VTFEGNKKHEPGPFTVPIRAAKSRIPQASLDTRPDPQQYPLRGGRPMKRFARSTAFIVCSLLLVSVTSFARAAA
jgi:hypothetical protein